MKTKPNIESEVARARREMAENRHAHPMTPPDSNQPVPFRELMEGATPGPKCPACEAARAKWNNIERKMASRGNFGLVPAPFTCDRHKNRDLEMIRFRREMESRLSPATMRLVLGALQFYAGSNDVDHATPAIEALSALNGNPINT